MNNIYIINSSGGKGKDTFVEIYENLTKERVLNISSVDMIKRAAMILDWDGKKDEKSRNFLAKLKQLAIEYNDHPVNYIKRWILSMNNNRTLFIHIREPEEIDKIRKEYPNIKTILIINNNVEDITSNDADGNVNNYKYDYYIDNNGNLEDYEKSIKKFIDQEV